MFRHLEMFQDNILVMLIPSQDFNLAPLADNERFLISELVFFFVYVMRLLGSRLADD